MVTRICISINNDCNLRCKYCHFHEKESYIQSADMNVFEILDNVIAYIEKNNIPLFKIGFVGNGEPLLAFSKLKSYIEYIAPYLKNGRISAYTITNGLLVDEEKLLFFQKHKINLGFSLDGLKNIHDKWRCNSYDKVIEKIELYKKIMGKYPSINCTVGADTLKYEDETIAFFKQFNTRITFSRMIGEYGIPLLAFQNFMEKAQKYLDVRTGGYDCTMYGGKCGAGMDNYFYANDKIYICGNCIDIKTPFPASTPLEKINFSVQPFDRAFCYKEKIRK